MANEVRIRTSVDDKASRPLKNLQDSWQRFRKEGAKGFVIGASAAATAKAFDLVGMAVSKTTDFIGDSISASRDLTEALNKSKVVFGDASKGVEAFGDTTATSLGISKRAAIDAAAGFGVFFTGLGKSQQESAEMSQKLVTLAGDLTSFYNLASTDDALQKLQSGLSGEAEPLRRVGVFLTEAKVKAKAMELGLADAHGELSEGAKVMARYQIILEETTLAQGDAANTIGELAGQQRVATASLEDAQAQVGKSFVPVELGLTKLQVVMLDVIKNWGVMSVVTKQFEEEAEDAAGATKALDDAMASGDNVHTYGDALDTATGKTYDLATAHDVAKQSVKELKDEMVSDANEIIDGYYKPLELRDEIQQNSSDITAAKRILNSKTASAAEREDARDTIREASKSNDKLALELLATGQMSEKEKKALIARVDKSVKTTTGRTRQYFIDLRREIAKLDGLTATINILARIRQQVHEPGSKAGGRASGGPVLPLKTYTVGEAGPETLVMGSQGGFVIPNGGGPPMGAPAGGMGGQVIINLHGMTYPPSSAQLQEMARVIGPAIRDYQNRRGA